MSRKRQIMVFTGSRAEYGLLFPVLDCLRHSPRLEYRLVVAGSHLSARLGSSLSEITDDGFEVARKIDSRVRGQKPGRMGLESAIVLRGVSRAIEAERPDFMLVLGDRYESFAAASAAFCAGVPVAHMAGGDITHGGLKDDTFRHAMTRLAHLHFPFTQASAVNIKAMGEEGWRVSVTGSPAADNFKYVRRDPSSKEVFKRLKIDGPYVLFTFHPDSPDERRNARQIETALKALAVSGLRVVVNAPNHDPGWQSIMEKLRQLKGSPGFTYVSHLGRRDYLALMLGCVAVVGNSSSGILESPIACVPAVNIGNRQKDRQAQDNVVHVPCQRKAIVEAMVKVQRPSFRQKIKKMAHPFGRGNTGERICARLASVKLDEKLMNKKYVFSGVSDTSRKRAG